MRAASSSGSGQRALSNRWHAGLLGVVLWISPCQTVPADVILTDCSLAALRAVMTDGGTIRFGCSGTNVFTQPIVVRTDTVLDADGHRVVLSGSTNSTQLFRVQPGVTFTLKGVTLLNGRNTNGGAIYNGGKLEVTDCVFSNNLALGPNGAPGPDGADQPVKGDDGGQGRDGLRAGGGALYNVCTAIVTRCTFLTNGAFAGNGGRGGHGGDGSLGGNGGDGGRGATALGGAIYSSGRLRVTNCLFQFNFVSGGDGGTGGTNGTGGSPGLLGHGGAGGMGLGGGLFLLERSFVAGSTFDRNYAFSGDSANAGTNTFLGETGEDGPDSQGGAICNQGTNTVVNCTFSGNGVAAGRGGNGAGSPNYGGDGGRGGHAWGGSVYNAGRALLTNCTLVGGITLPGAAGQKGAGAVPGTQGKSGENRGGNAAHNGTYFLLQNSLLAAAKSGTNLSFTTNLTNGLNAFGPITDGGYNLSDDATPVFSSGTSRHHATVLIGTLGSYGGLTPTIPLQSGSPAIDQIPSGFPPTDQRGVPRPVRALGDIGAYEEEGWTISGRITEGGRGREGVTVSAGQKTALTDSSGHYTLYGLTLGVTKTVVPTLAGYLFDPPSASVRVMPGATNVNFEARTREIAIALVNQQVQLTFVGTPSATYQIQASPHLASPIPWQTLATATADTNGILHYSDPTPASLPARFYRVRSSGP